MTKFLPLHHGRELGEFAATLLPHRRSEGPQANNGGTRSVTAWVWQDQAASALRLGHPNGFVLLVVRTSMSTRSGMLQ